MRNLTVFALFLGSAFAVFTGCARHKELAANSGRFYAVTAPQTGFYRYGPQQGNGPDEQLTRDTVVTLIRPSFGYAKVQLTGGTQGYVSSDDIRPAPPTLVAALTAPPELPPSNTGFDFGDSAAPPQEDELPAPDLPPMEDPAAAASTEPAP